MCRPLGHDPQAPMLPSSPACTRWNDARVQGAIANPYPTPLLLMLLCQLLVQLTKLRSRHNQFFDPRNVYPNGRRRLQ